MDIKYGKGLEFETEDPLTQTDPATASSNESKKLEGIIRHSYRLPSGDEDQWQVRINNEHFDVVNIGSRGVGITYREVDRFSVGEEIKALTLFLQDIAFNLTGKVVHITPDFTGAYLCGIELLNLSAEEEKKIREYIQGKSGCQFESNGGAECS